MKQLLYLLKYESKTIVRDPINLYMALFPFIILALASFVFPRIFKSIDPSEVATLQMTTLLLLVIILSLGAFFLAAMATFLLLEHKDESTLHTIAVTPLGISGYIKFKMSYIYILGVISTIIVLLGTKLIAGDQYVIGDVSLFDQIGFIKIITFSLVSNLFTPTLGLLLASLAKNKIEGFAFIKGTGLIALLPALLILETFQGGLQYLLGIFPNFWAIKGMMQVLYPVENSANLNFTMYLIIGFIYNVVVLVAAYKLFLKKAQY